MRACLASLTACPARNSSVVIYSVTRTKLFCDHMRLWAVVGISEFKELKTEMTDVLKKLNVKRNTCLLSLFV